MRLNKFFLLGAAGLALASCADNLDTVDNGGVDGKKGYARIEVRTSGSLSRADIQSASESNLLNLKFYQGSLSAKDFERVSSFSSFEQMAENTFGWNATQNAYYSGSWQAAAGQYSMGLVANYNAGAPSLDGASADNSQFVINAKGDLNAFEKMAVEDATDATKSSFLMSSITESKTVGEGGTKAAPSEVSFKLERVLAKGVVKVNIPESSKVKENGKTFYKAGENLLVDSASIEFAAINGAVKSYLFGNFAGSQDDNMNRVTTAGKVVKSAIHALTVNDVKVSTESNTEYSKANYPTVADNLVRLGDYYTTSMKTGIFGPVAANGTKGVYFLENSGEDFSANAFGYNRYAFARIYATVRPTQNIWKLEGATVVQGTATDIALGQTFWRGVKDGASRFYVTRAAAVQDGVDEKYIYTYTNGKCAYRVLWNKAPQGDATTTFASTRRNMVYQLTISGISQIGMNYDQLDPNDPNLPKANDDKSDPTKDPTKDPSIDKKNTWMAVTATIEDWKVAATDGVVL